MQKSILQQIFINKLLILIVEENFSPIDSTGKVTKETCIIFTHIVLRLCKKKYGLLKIIPSPWLDQ